MMNNKIRVIVIDDSAFMRKVISDILMSDPRLDVIATARHGQDGLKKIKTLNPDVVTLDVEMPIMDGLTTLQHIMADHPVPVVMLSSGTNEGATKTVQAIAMGAVDFIAKTSGPISLDIHNIKDEIITKVLTASKAKVSKQTLTNKRVLNDTWQRIHPKTVIAIGTSTGGPRALQYILSRLPKDFPAALLIVQHMPAGFTKSLADRLNDHANIKVKEARHGEIIQSGTAYIAPGGFHMTVQKVGTTEVIKLTEDQPLHGHRPSVDALFNSIATLKQLNKIAVILTGMGKDGAQGIKRIKKLDRQSMIIAESKETAIVNGMPTAAVNTQCVNKVVSLHHISDTLIHLV